MARPLLSLLLGLVGAAGANAQAAAIDFGRYHSQDEINAYLHDMAREHPELVRHHLLGYSQQGREIDYVTVSGGDPDALPAIYLNGTHHGDEKSSTETVLATLDFLVKNRHQKDVAELLDTYAVYLQPLVNPDGHALNSRYDCEGRDPNRDYSYPERSDEESFKVPAIRLVKELSDKVRFHAALAFHSGMEGVLWGWAYSGSRLADADVFYTLAKATARAMGMRRYLQSYTDYPSKGEFIDYEYMTHGTFALTVEVSNEPTPPPAQLPLVVHRAVAGAMAFMLSLLELDKSELKLERAVDPTQPAAMALRPLATRKGDSRTPTARSE